MFFYTQYSSSFTCRIPHRRPLHFPMQCDSATALPLYDSIGVGPIVTVSSIESLVPELKISMDPLVLHIRTPQRSALRCGTYTGNAMGGQSLLFCMTDFSPLLTTSSVREADQVAMAVRPEVPFFCVSRHMAIVYAATS
jgi:hypothetical protein